MEKIRQLESFKRKYKMVKKSNPKTINFSDAKGLALEIFDEAFVIIECLQKENERLRKSINPHHYSHGA